MCRVAMMLADARIWPAKTSDGPQRARGTAGVAHDQFLAAGELAHKLRAFANRKHSRYITVIARKSGRHLPARLVISMRTAETVNYDVRPLFGLVHGRTPECSIPITLRTALLLVLCRGADRNRCVMRQIH